MFAFFYFRINKITTNVSYNVLVHVIMFHIHWLLKIDIQQIVYTCSGIVVVVFFKLKIIIIYV